MTNKQAAEVLRKFSKWFPSVAEGDKEVHAALETAIAVMEAKTSRFDVEKELREIKQWIAENHEEHDKIVKYLDSLPDDGPIVLPAQLSTPPTDEQIGQIFDNRFDCYADTVNISDDGPPAMTRTAFIQAVRECMTPCYSK